MIMLKFSKKVTCPVCGELLKSRDELKLHMQRHSLSEKLSCTAMGEFNINPLESPKAFGVVRNIMGTLVFFLLLLLAIALLYLLNLYA